MKYKIEQATPDQAAAIAPLIMIAMDEDCCRHFCGPHHSLDDFRTMMTRLVERDDSQYSYHNTLVAKTTRGDIAGIITGYDGSMLRTLRKAFVQSASEALGNDFSGMADETQAGEFYVDSLAVKTEYRKQGIASALLREMIRRNRGSQPVGLLVDLTHPWAERLYLSLGFRFVGTATWGGHQMKHLQYPPRCPWAIGNPLLEKYHDEEWGVPVHDERRHFEMLVLECMSCGLSWLMMLERREVFRQCFAGFDPELVARFTDDDIRRIVSTRGMIRSLRKVTAMVNNAKVFLQTAKEFGTFDQYIWHFTEGQTWTYPSHQREWPTSNALSGHVAKDMKRRGFQYVGTTIIYSHLQSIGIINDHQDCCFRRSQLPAGTIKSET